MVVVIIYTYGVSINCSLPKHNPLNLFKTYNTPLCFVNKHRQIKMSKFSNQIVCLFPLNISDNPHVHPSIYIYTSDSLCCIIPITPRYHTISLNWLDIHIILALLASQLSSIYHMNKTDLWHCNLGIICLLASIAWKFSNS